VLQVMLNVMDFGMNPQEAVDAPRFHHQWLPDAISIERGFSPDAIALLRSRGHEVREETGRRRGRCRAGGQRQRLSSRSGRRPTLGTRREILTSLSASAGVLDIFVVIADVCVSARFPWNFRADQKAGRFDSRGPGIASFGSPACFRPSDLLPHSACALLPLVASAQPAREIRAVRISQPLKLDGRLDEEIYEAVAPAGDFVQQLPRGGPRRHRADRRLDIFRRRQRLRLDSGASTATLSGWSPTSSGATIATSSRSTTTSASSSTRSTTAATAFSSRPTRSGAVRDQAVKDGRQIESWNTVWAVKTARFEHGYTVEMVIPFKSLRYRGAGAQTWGVNFRRVVKWKNEVSNLTLVPASYGSAGVTQMATAATLVGLETPAQALTSRSSRTASPR
jgi:hypothetical protein